MKKIIRSTFLLLLVFVNVAYLPQAIIAILSKVPLISSINYSYEYISLGLKNDFPIIRYSKDILIVLLFILINIDILKRRLMSKKSFMISICTLLFLVPFSIGALMFSDEFSTFMIIAGIRIIIFPITIIVFAMEYIDNEFIKSVYKALIKILKIVFIITVFQSLIIVNKYNTINIAKYRLIGTFAGSGLLGLFGLGIINFLILYKLRIDENIKISTHIIMIGFIIFASGTRTAMIVYSLIVFSYCYYINVNRKRNYKLTNLFILLSLTLGMIALNLAEFIADRGSAISAQFEGGRVTFILDYLSSSNLKEILFGKGIGYGTNTALSMITEIVVNAQSNTRVMDGTINILITQFGLIMTVIICMLYIYIIKKVLLTSIPSEIKIVFIVTNIILIVIGNILEQFSFQLLFIINHTIVIKNLDKYKEGY